MNENPSLDTVHWLVKIVRGFSITAILLLMCVSLSIIIGGQIIGDELNLQKEGTDIRETTMTLLATSQEMRRREKDFLIRRDFLYSDKYYVLSDYAQKIVDKLQNMEEGQKYYRMLSQLGDTLQEHNQQFSIVILALQNLGIDPNKGLLGVFNKTLPDIENQMRQHNFSADTINMWKAIELAYMKYLYSGELPADQTIKQKINILKQAIVLLPLEKEVIDLTVTNIDKSLMQFNNVQMQQQIYAKELAKLTTIFSNFEVAIDNLIDITRVTSQGYYDELVNSVYYWKLVVSLLALFTSLVIGIIAIVIFRKIIKDQ
jgi:hypothetical protein